MPPYTPPRTDAPGTDAVLQTNLSWVTHFCSPVPRGLLSPTGHTQGSSPTKAVQPCPWPPFQSKRSPLPWCIPHVVSLQPGPATALSLQGSASLCSVPSFQLLRLFSTSRRRNQTACSVPAWKLSTSMFCLPPHAGPRLPLTVCLSDRVAVFPRAPCVCQHAGPGALTSTPQDRHGSTAVPVPTPAPVGSHLESSGPHSSQHRKLHWRPEVQH